MKARYRFAAEKALQAVHWMVSQGVPVDLHAALKTAYFADKSHLNEHLQPIFGATYRAMKFGPVPLEIYEIIKGEALRMWELGREDLPWKLDGYKLRLVSNEPVIMDAFAQSEIEHLEAAFRRSVRMSFTERTAATHGRDWQAANGGTMSYEDMIEDRPDAEDAINFIQETARHVRL
ncbi:Panacea domain-containing protein [Paracoccus yeei]|uniref:Panacea domain-containing protein n=1 Tax=Paracoccus yeei TaxID=147645 RepID=UPI0028D90DB8|nr:Panacea domain-containing protein [Paracoccus yeei]